MFAGQLLMSKSHSIESEFPCLISKPPPGGFVFFRDPPWLPDLPSVLTWSAKKKIIVPEFSPQKRQVIDLIYFAIPVGGTTR